MTRPVLTKWHRLVDASKTLNINALFGGRVPGGAVEHVYEPGSTLGFNPEAFSKLIHNIKPVPKFFFTDEAMQLSNSESSKRTLDAMSEAGVLKLPFPAMLVEYEVSDNGHRAMVLILQDESSKFTMHSLVLRNYLNEDWVMLTPWTIVGEYLSIAFETGERAIRYELTRVPYFKNVPPIKNDNEAEFYSEMASRALVAALVLLNTRGICKVTEPAPTALNKVRRAKGRSPIPEVTTIRIGSYTTREGRTVNVKQGERRPPRIHMRRGHVRHVPYGPRKGVTGERPTRLTFIEAVLVNYDPDEHSAGPLYEVRK